MDIGESIVKAVVLHQVGNRLREEPLVLAGQSFVTNESISNLILSGYLRGIVGDKNKYMLTHESDIALNDVAHHASDFFSQKISFIEVSNRLATHLYASAHHPNIAAGDLFIILFDRLKVDGAYKAALGIYKSEAKQQYLSMRTEGATGQLEVSSGINPELIDKGALIVDGSNVIYAVDRLSSRTKYWFEDFLKAKQIFNEGIKSTVTIGLIEKVRECIESPVVRQEFCREVVDMCSGMDEVLIGDIRGVSERYISSKVWDEELDRIVERKGLVESGEIRVSTKSLASKMKKVMSRIDLGSDIALMIPEGLSFDSVELEAAGGFLQIRVTLEKSNG